MHPSIPPALRNIGLEKETIDMYLALLKLGKSKASELAKAARVNRSVAYKHLDELVARGLVQVQISEGTKLFFPNDPDVLSGIADEQHQEVQRAIPELTKLFAKSGARKPVIRTYTDVAGVKVILQELLETPSKYYRVIGAGAQPEIRQLLTDKLLVSWTKERIARRVGHQSLRPLKSHAALKKLDPILTRSHPDVFREIRYSSLPDDIPLLIYLYDGKVAFVDGRIGHIYSTIIESKDTFDIMNGIFDVLWAGAKRPEEVE